MPTANPDKILAFASSKDLGKWLKKNHAAETELWIKIFKKATRIPSVTWDDVVIEALCWGWIDGIKKSFDEQSYLQRITPRRAKSDWSKRNTEHVQRLLKEGRMQEPGLVHVRAAKSDGRWDNAYSLTKPSRFVIAYGLTSAKKPDTRKRRFAKYIDMLSRQEKPS